MSPLISSDNLENHQMIKGPPGIYWQQAHKLKKDIKNNKILNIYGKDYGTIDGTCERDYIHITDLLNAHEKTINFIKCVF